MVSTYTNVSKVSEGPVRARHPAEPRELLSCRQKTHPSPDAVTSCSPGSRSKLGYSAGGMKAHKASTFKNSPLSSISQLQSDLLLGTNAFHSVCRAPVGHGEEQTPGPRPRVKCHKPGAPQRVQDPVALTPSATGSIARKQVGGVRLLIAFPPTSMETTCF